MSGQPVGKAIAVSLCCARISAVGFIAGLGILTAHAGPSHTPEASIPLASYQHLIVDYDHAVAGKGRIAPRDASALESRFQLATVVRMPDGTTVRPANSREIDGLRHIAATPRGAEPDEDTRDRAPVLRELVSPSGDRSNGIGDPSANVRKVLSASEFRYSNHKPPDVNTDWLERWVRNVGHAIKRFLRWIFGRNPHAMPDTGKLTGLAQFVRYFFITVLIVAAATALGFFGLRLYQNRGLLLRRRLAAASGLDLSPEEMPDPLASAHRLAERGDYRGAVRLAYIACLRLLAASGLLVLEANRTNWEYQSALRSRSQSAYAVLLPGTGLFDRIWYGRRPAGERDFALMTAIHDSLVSASDNFTTSAVETGESAR